MRYGTIRQILAYFPGDLTPVLPNGPMVFGLEWCGMEIHVQISLGALKRAFRRLSVRMPDEFESRR